MPKEPEVPAHRAASDTRSGDTHVISAHGKLKNLDEEARAKAEAEEPSAKTERAPPGASAA